MNISLDKLICSGDFFIVCSLVVHLGQLIIASIILAAPHSFILHLGYSLACSPNASSQVPSHSFMCILMFPTIDCQDVFQPFFCLFLPVIVLLLWYFAECNSCNSCPVRAQFMVKCAIFRIQQWHLGNTGIQTHLSNHEKQGKIQCT